MWGGVGVGLGPTRQEHICNQIKKHLTHPHNLLSLPCMNTPPELMTDDALTIEQAGWPGDGSGEDDLADHNANEADDYRNEGNEDAGLDDYW